MFMWVTSRATELGIECLERWGYEVVEEIVWVKVN
jgi:mRNA (2'-O-methyladenosine-N6-)-methyltransferase